MKIIQIYPPVDSDVSIKDYFDSQTISCLISLSNFTNNKEAIEWQISHSSESREVMLEMRA